MNTFLTSVKTVQTGLLNTIRIIYRNYGIYHSILLVRIVILESNYFNMCHHTVIIYDDSAIVPYNNRGL